MLARVDRASKSAMLIWLALWGFIEPLAWLGLIPTPTWWIRAIFLASVVAGFVIMLTRRPSREDSVLFVQVQPGIVHHPVLGTRDLVSVEVQNHSSSSVFIAQISLQMTGGLQLICFRDDFTGELFHRRELRPGESYSLNLDPAAILSDGRSIGQFTAAVARDALGREYLSDSTALRRALKAASQK
jgi:hypothetical protein